VRADHPIRRIKVIVKRALTVTRIVGWWRRRTAAARSPAGRWAHPRRRRPRTTVRRETYCTMCLFDVAVLAPEQGWQCEVCEVLITGRPDKRYCGNACACRAKTRRRHVPLTR
jgi:hypothetical protein